MNTDTLPSSPLLGAPLGRDVRYQEHYAPQLLFAVPRQPHRDEQGIPAGALPFHGADLWHAYEISWLDKGGKPTVALGRFRVPADSPCLIESKSLKLYLNSFNQSTFDDAWTVESTIADDLSRVAGAPVEVSIYPLLAHPRRHFSWPQGGICLDGLDVRIDTYTPHPDYLRTRLDAPIVTETLYSNLLKSNCLITRQPDWATLIVQYRGPAIDRTALLRYIVSFRQHCEFHEPCVERIFCDILRRCQPEELTVFARYTRRGGLDINPLRSTRADFAFPEGEDIRQ